MKIKSGSNKPVDPSNFLWALSRKISESRHAPFNFNSQQDAAEVLPFVIDELKGTSVVASDLISNIRINISCNQCFCFSAKEEKLDILTIPLSPNINSSLSKFLKPETPVDPSNFLWALSRKISESRHAPFNFNSQQDAAEVLQFVIDELKGTSVVASDLISNIRINISCNQCFCFSAKEEKLDILTIPLSPNINSSLSKFLKPEILESENKWFCPSCNCLTESTRETSIIGLGSILVIQLSRFSNSHSRLLKDQQVFNFSPELDLKVPITVEDEVSFSSKYSLVASINHSGTLEKGHYWAVVKDSNTGDWLSCNDKVVKTVPQHSLNNTTSYILFYKKN